MMENTNRLGGKPPHILGLIILSAFASMGAVLMTPAIPNIALFFDIHNGIAQLVVTSFLLGYAIGPLIYGPLANRFGRKKAFYIGIGLSTLGSLFSILSSPFESFDLLILGRALEALGSSVGLVVCLTIINDFYFPEKSRKVISLMTLTFAIVPAIAVALGGVLTNYFGWQSCFYFLLAYGLILIIPAAKMPETLIKKDLSALKLSHLYKNYLAVFKIKKLWAYSMIFGFSTACAYLFAAEGPMIGINELHFAPATYGLLGMIPSLGALMGSLFSAKCASFFSAKKMVMLGFVLELLTSLVILGFFLVGLINLYTLLIPTIVLMMGHAIIMSNASSLAMIQTEDKSHGSSMMNFVSLWMAVLMTFVLGMVQVSSALIMPILFLITLFLMLMTLCWVSYLAGSKEN